MGEIGCKLFWLGLHYHAPPAPSTRPQHERVSMHWRHTLKCVSVLLGGAVVCGQVRLLVQGVSTIVYEWPRGSWPIARAAPTAL
eukprot:3449387-Prymnesium_polylepis.1